MKRFKLLTTISMMTAAVCATSCSSSAQSESESVTKSAVSAPVASNGITILVDADGNGTPEMSQHSPLIRFAGSDVHAVILHNCDDDNGDGEPDDLDAIVNGDQDLKDMLAIDIIANDFKADQTITITIADTDPENYRIFNQNTEGVWRAVDFAKPVSMTIKELQASPRFYIEAREFAGKSWNGEMKLEVSTANSSDSFLVEEIYLRVAPWLMLSNASEAETLYIREHTGRNDRMIEQLKTILPNAGAKLQVIPASAPYPGHNIWLQDTLEIGRQFTPNASMPVVLQANRNKGIDDFSKTSLLGPDFGWMRVGEFRPKYGAGDKDFEWLDWFGNLEVSPPLPGYPHGRMYYGQAGEGNSMDPRIVSKIGAQGLQKPFAVDVSYLIIKHADETISFVPGKEGGPEWFILVPSPAEMINLAKQIQADGHGDLPMLEPFEDGYTINTLLADAAGIKLNMDIEAGALERNIQTMKRELGLTDEQFIKVPAFIKPGGASLIPNMVNSTFVNGTYLVPDPNGPMVDGKDLIQEDFRKRMENSSAKIEFIDDQQYHRWLGNVHCATNVKRTGAEHIEPLKN